MEGLIEGDTMPVTLGVGQHSVAIEDQRRHQALPSLPNRRMWLDAIS